ncbi:HAD-like domain-containing protein [Melanogaster broomeanus]|nr:HAD-like domain-containing protein [Melanogaster broomeanus]
MPQETITFDAVLFDLDGTLIDSTPGVYYAWDEFRKKYTHLPSDVADLTHGRRLKDTLREYCRITDDAELEASRPVNGLGPEVLNGAQKLLNELNEIAPDKWTIVTSASRFYASQAIPKCSLPIPRKGYVTADDVTEGKPKPAPYNAGAATLGVPAEKCLVVEDAPSGLKAGRAAGARTLAVCTSHGPESLFKEAGGSIDYIVKDLEGVSAKLAGDMIEFTLTVLPGIERTSL